jgi:hypothetical protein
MAKSKRIRQKKLAAKRSKKVSKRKSAQSKEKHPHSDRQIMPLAKCPIHETLIPDNLFEMGIGIAVFSRMLPDGKVALGMFLVDVYCLGVKDASIGELSMPEYEKFLTRGEPGWDWKEIDPECLVKLTLESIDYAANLGFSPHKDYRQAKKIFGTITGYACEQTFQFGMDGKPLYVAGPHDTPERIEKILKQLERAVGPDGYHFICPVGGDGPDEDNFIM